MRSASAAAALTGKHGEVIDAYLTRLGLEQEPPSAAALRRLHQAHVEQVPYETVWIHTGVHYGVSAEESFARIASTTRGGYCFHLNGAFSELLRRLGYHVVRHVGGVHGPAGPSNDEMTNHLVLTVHDLPSDDNPSGDWYVDTGLGDALHDPLPLHAGVFEQPPFRLELVETPGEIGDWHLRHDAAGTFTGMAWRAEPAAMTAFESMHATLSTAPDSGFVKILSLQRRHARSVDIVRGLTLSRVGDGAYERVMDSRDDLASTLHDVFGLDLAEFADGDLDRLWQRTHAAHIRWQEAN
jgi:N-hydroxyarylamine O-acetyltransferase